MSTSKVFMRIDFYDDTSPKLLLEKAPGRRRRDGHFTRLDGMEVVEVLWRLNELLHPHFDQMTSLPYVPDLEEAADAVIKAYAGRRDTWRSTGQRLATLLERYIRAQIVVLANYGHGNHSVLPFPAALPESAIGSRGAVLLLCDEVVIPRDQSFKASVAGNRLLQRPLAALSILLVWAVLVTEAHWQLPRVRVASTQRL